MTKQTCEKCKSGNLNIWNSYCYVCLDCGWDSDSQEYHSDEDLIDE